MSIQWTLIAGFLYVEIALVLLLVLPVASPKRWQAIFRSRFLAVLARQASLYFYMLLFVLVLFLLDAIREMRKFSHSETHEKTAGHVHLDQEMQVNMRLFRAQRNFYITGFALFLCLVIRRLCALISLLATMQAQSEAALKQAASATSAATSLLAAQKDAPSQKSVNQADDSEVKTLTSEIRKLKKELESKTLDLEFIKKQAESTNAEYDRLNEEYNKLKKQFHVTAEGDKKQD